jgi:hypothetical protein
MLESEFTFWREKLSQGLPEGKQRDEDLNGPVLVSEMAYLRDAGVPHIRLGEIAKSLDVAGRSVKAVKSALRREADNGPKALRNIAQTWGNAISTLSDAVLAREHFLKLAKATSLADKMRDRARRGG